MSDSLNHAPTPEFRAALEREVARAFRADVQFARSPHTRRARRLGLVLASGAGTFAVLVIGLVFGTSTGYASARAQNDRQRDETAATTVGATNQLAELRMDLSRARDDLARIAAAQGAISRSSLRSADSDLRAMEASAGQIALDLTQHRESRAPASPSIVGGIPMKTALAVTCSALALGAPVASAQQAIPTVTLGAPTAKTTLALWSVAGVKQLAGGKLLVNDQDGREVRVFDSTLANSVVTVDSMSYGARRARMTPLSAYLGDSSLIAGPAANTLRVLDGSGRVARTITLPSGSLNFAGPVYADGRGRLLFASPPLWRVAPVAADSVAVVRFDIASGRIDTVGRVKSAAEHGFTFSRDSAAPSPLIPMRGVTQSLVPGRDDWAVLSDGSIAFVRGKDYHIDWSRADGAMSSTPKLPFDWQHLADDNMKFVADSAYLKHVITPRNVGGADSAKKEMATKLYKAQVNLYNLTLAMQPLANAAIPDLDGNLWILPTTPRDKNSEVIYDVVNAKGELFQRVRIPTGRSIAGFGKGGVVYLASGDRNDGYFLERTKLTGSSR